MIPKRIVTIMKLEKQQYSYFYSLELTCELRYKDYT